MGMSTRRQWQMMVGMASVGALLATGGCGDLQEIIRAQGMAKPDKPTEADVTEASAQGDYEKLKGICQGGGDYRILNKACIAAAEVLGERKDLATLTAICKEGGQGEAYERWRERQVACKQKARIEQGVAGEKVAAAGCEQLVETYEQQRDALTSSELKKQQRNANLLQAGLRLVACDKWDYIWEHVAHYGQDSSGMGHQLLLGLHQAGHDIAAQMLAYLKRHASKPLDIEHAYYVGSHFVDFLLLHGDPKKCKAYFPYVKKLSDDGFRPFNWYFRKVECRGAEQLALPRLASRHVGTRSGACRTLGVLGKRKHLAKVERLAKTDPVYQEREVERQGRIWLVKDYPVRDVCAEAANQIAIRR